VSRDDERRARLERTNGDTERGPYALNPRAEKLPSCLADVSTVYPGGTGVADARTDLVNRLLSVRLTFLGYTPATHRRFLKHRQTRYQRQILKQRSGPRR
jgi:hypothetical protein